MAKAVVYLAVAVALPCSAQEMALGRYTATYTSAQTQAFQTTITLDIRSVESGNVRGIGTRYTLLQNGRPGRLCVGEFPISGTVKGDDVDIGSSQKFGGTEDCSFRLRGKFSGDKIEGKIGPIDVVLTR